jgi:hypothetical protein
MAKPVALTADDLTPQKKPRASSASRPRGETASADYVPLQFRLPPEFVKTFKQAALDRNMKLNELLIYCFNEFMKTRAKGS